ncbi:MAG: radical SAM protein [Pirellulales bacterium]|nr:radical SAM protein [Pirellulales bacterium]
MVKEALAPAAARAAAHYRECLLCEHRCGVNRIEGELGRCKAGAVARVFRHRIEYGEEEELVPSHLFYLSGCDLRCKFCIAEEKAFDPRIGDELTAESFAELAAWGASQGAINVQWVGGEPTIHLPAILQAMRGCANLPPVVWKSDFYGTAEALALLDGVVDVYVADFKFGNEACARRIAGVDRYVETVTRNLALAWQNGDLIVRHLLLPGHFDCCYRAVVQWLSTCLPRAKFSLRDGYRPRWVARSDGQLNRRLSVGEIQQAEALARAAGLRVIK